MDINQKRGVAKRGSIFKLEKVTFPPQKTQHAKYCVLLENYSNFKKDIIVAFTTSNEGYRGRLSAVEIPKGEYACFLLNTFICLTNHRIVRVETLFGENSAYEGQLVKSDIERLNQALEFAVCSKANYVRMMG